MPFGGLGDAGLIDEDDAEAGADDGFGREQEGEADARCDVAVVQFAGAAGVAVDAEVIQLLRSEIEDSALVGFLNRWEVEGPAGADVCGEAVGQLPVVLHKIFFDVIAGADFAFL